MNIVSPVSALENQLAKLIHNSNFTDSARGLPPVIMAEKSINISRLGKANSANSKYSQRWQMSDFRGPFRNHFPL